MAALAELTRPVRTRMTASPPARILGLNRLSTSNAPSTPHGDERIETIRFRAWERPLACTNSLSPASQRQNSDILPLGTLRAQERSILVCHSRSEHSCGGPGQ